MAAPAHVGPLAVNEVHLVGRVSAATVERELPSGDVIATFRVVVPRAEGAISGSRQRVDALDCVVWPSRLRRSTGTWNVDDQVEVRGALRRRFYRGGAGAVSRFEVEVTSGRVIRRATT